MTPTAPPREDSPGVAPPEVEQRQWLSAFADGDADAANRSIAMWREDPGARERWHLYHLIGDVLRSEDLSSTPRRDAQFLAGLRERLAAEPVPFAPAAVVPKAATRARRLGWRAPVAVAAGFAAVATALVALRPQGFGFAGDQLAADSAPRLAGEAGGARPRVSAAPAGGPLVSDGAMLRDPRLEAFLQAHQSARGGAPAALPFGGLRNAEVVVVPMAPTRVPSPRVAPDAAAMPRAASEAR
ncbi:MAG: sigma-E factor negative regulatory protein [Rubrivivax sp.]|nr:sigma-E factor negative regulatory protein [Rubrivivax sp.]